MSDVTRILEQIRAGDTSGTERLLREVYDELRRLAADKLARERSGQTLQATALVHEAWLRLTGGDPTPQWNSPGHFFGAAAEAMRRILVENARRKQRVRHGGGQQRVDLDSQCAVESGPACQRTRVNFDAPVAGQHRMGHSLGVEDARAG